MKALSLRARVALAFLLTTAVAMLALGVYVQLRVEHTLDRGLREQVESEAERILLLPPHERARAMERMTGEFHGQLLDRDGAIVASSPTVPGRLVDSGLDDGYTDVDVKIYDDLYEHDEDLGNPEVEREAAVALVRSDDENTVVVAISREDADDAVKAVRQQLLISGPVALAIAGALGYLVAGLGIRPIERMRARAATISSRSAGERLPVPPAQELRRLAITLNAMLDRLDEGLERERRFVADASHELRTPLALLLTEVELALSGSRSQEELLEALRSAKDEVSRLIALSEDLLALVGAASGRLALQTEKFDLAALAADVVRRFRATAESASRTVRLVGDRSVRVEGDPERLGRVVSNLVDNALKHGRGDVEVRVTRGAGVVLEVSDEGDGFQEENPFERFTASHGSVGLGLAIVDEIVHAHGGRIEIAREHGRTLVRVSLPAVSRG